MLSRFLLCLALGCWSSLVVAQTPESAQAVIRAQIQALANDDAEHAFSYAADTIRAQFGDAQRFVRMVRSQYPALYRPRQVLFSEPVVVTPEQMFQELALVDERGQAWRVIYSLHAMAGEWRIDGVVLARSQQQAI